MSALRKPSYEELEAEVFYLRNELGLVRESETVGLLMAGLRLTANEARLLLGLYRVAPKPMSCQRLTEITKRDDANEDICDRLAQVYVCKVRRKLGFDTIDTIRSHGWRLSPKGVALCQEALG